MVNSVTHLGIGDVTVEVAGNNATTDLDGRFRVTDLAPGKYTARFRHEAFTDPRSDEAAERTFTISATADPAHVEVELTPCATLRGRLLDRDGQPMPGIHMQLLRLR